MANIACGWKAASKVTIGLTEGGVSGESPRPNMSFEESVIVRNVQSAALLSVSLVVAKLKLSGRR